MQRSDWLKRADFYFCVSNFAKNALEAAFSIPEDRVVALGMATESKVSLTKIDSFGGERLKKKLKISEYILYVPGGLDNRMNFDGLIKAYSLLDFTLSSKYQLIIAGMFSSEERLSIFHELASSLGIKPGRIFFIGNLTDHELHYFYHHASLFVFPAHHEEFALPVLEAMHFGCPIIGSNCSSIPEVIGLESALFDPFSAESISQKMTKCLLDNEYARSLVEHQKSQSNKFSWSKAVKLALDFLSKKNIAPAAHTKGDDFEVNPKMPALHKKILDSFLDKEQRNPSPIELAFMSNSLAYNLGSGKTKQLLFDVSAIVIKDDKSGIQRVVKSLVTQFIDNAPDGFDVFPVYFDGKNYRYTDKFQSSKNEARTNAALINNCPVDFWQDDIFIALDLTINLYPIFDSVHLRMRQIGVELYFIVYDLLPLKQPDWFPAPGPEYFKAWMRKITEHADGLVCISAAVANELREWIEENPLKRRDGAPVISSFHLGADIENSRPSLGMPAEAKGLLKLFKENKTFLMVSTLEPRKGHAQTIRAFDKLWKEGHEVILVLVGKNGWKVDELVQTIEEHPMLNQSLFWLQGVSDEYLAHIYQSATCLIAASEGEGFGLPLIESAHHKIPIIARDLPVFKEVAQDYAHYFSTRKAENLATAILEWLELYESNRHPKSDGMPWLNWKESANQLLNSIIPRK